MECSRLGFNSIVCSNGQEGYKSFCANKDDVCLVLSDVRMPVKDGTWMIQQIRTQHGTKVPFIFMSGFADISLWDAFDMGADSFMGKPFRLEALTEIINQLRTPLADRWKLRTIAVDNTVDFSFPTSEMAAGPAGFRVGRGGFYLGTFDDSLRRGQFVSYNIGVAGSPSALVGTGVVRWIRYGLSSGELRSAGIEFLFLEEQSQKAVVNHIKKTDPVAYIPATPARPQ